MIEICSHSELGARPDRAHQLFSQRYDVFIRRLRWNIPSRGFYEFDQYDRDGTIYILAVDSHGKISGSCRLLPTTAQYMLSDIFLPLWGSKAPPPHAPSIFELSRFCISGEEDPAWSAGENCRLTTELFAAMTEYVLKHGGNEVLAVVTLPILRIIRRLIGGEPQWQGPIVQLDGIKSLAIRFQVVDEILRRLHDKLAAELDSLPLSETGKAA